MNNEFTKGEFNLVQVVKLILIGVGGAIIAFGVLKTAYYAERIYWAIINDWILY